MEKMGIKQQIPIEKPSGFGLIPLAESAFRRGDFKKTLELVREINSYIKKIGTNIVPKITIEREMIKIFELAKKIGQSDKKDDPLAQLISDVLIDCDGSLALKYQEVIEKQIQKRKMLGI